jgi:putative transposase
MLAPHARMARPPRLELAGVPLHIIQRGVNRAACFFSDVDRRFYLKCLGKFAARRGCLVHAYVLMTNHVHLLVTPGEKGATAAMLQDLGRTYVRVINTVHSRSGTLWEGRYKSSLVDTETYLLACHRYIELNPVRAGIASEPGEYPWSSHTHYTSDRPNSLITEHSLYHGLGANRMERQAAFRSMFLEPLKAETLKHIRTSTNAGSALGSETFMEHLQTAVGRNGRLPRRGRPPKGDATVAATEIVSGKLL